MSDKTDDEKLADGDPFTERGKAFLNDLVDLGIKHKLESGLTMDETIAALLVAAVAAARMTGAIDVLPINFAIVLGRDREMMKDLEAAAEATKQ